MNHLLNPIRPPTRRTTMQRQKRILNRRTIKRQLILNRSTRIHRRQTRHKITINRRTRTLGFKVYIPRTRGSGRLLALPTKDARIGCAFVGYAVVPHGVADLLAAAEAGEAGGCGKGVCGGGGGDLGEAEGGAGLAPFGGVDGASGAIVGGATG